MSVPALLVSDEPQHTDAILHEWLAPLREFPIQSTGHALKQSTFVHGQTPKNAKG